MGGFSLIHWLILGVVILLLFGGNRFSSMMGDVAKGLKSFKHGMSEDEEEERRRKAEEQRRVGSVDRPIDVTPHPRAADPVAASPPPSSDTIPR